MSLDQKYQKKGAHSQTHTRTKMFPQKPFMIKKEKKLLIRSNPSSPNAIAHWVHVRLRQQNM